MRRLILLLILMTIGCASDRAEWSSGNSAESSFQEQRYQEQVESVRKQVPEARPNF